MAANWWWGFTDGYHTGMLSSIGIDKEGHNTGMGHTETRALHKLILYETACPIPKVSYLENVGTVLDILGMGQH